MGKWRCTEKTKKTSEQTTVSVVNIFGAMLASK